MSDCVYLTQTLHQNTVVKFPQHKKSAIKKPKTKLL